MGSGSRRPRLAHDRVLVQLCFLAVLVTGRGWHVSAGEWPSLGFLRTASSSKLRHFLMPIVNMTTLSYTQVASGVVYCPPPGLGSALDALPPL